MSVPPESSPRRPYHHGRLREALVEAGLGLARTGGPDAVVLRAVSREAGVSHSAGYRHFADHDDLLVAVGHRCMTELAALMARRADEVPPGPDVERAAARLTAIGRAYVEFAVTEPGWFRTAFSSLRGPHPVAIGDGALREGPVDPATGSPADPFGQLSARLDDLVAVGALPPERRPGAEFAAWSVVHGLSSLLVDGPLQGAPPELVEHAVSAALGVVSRGL